MTFGTLFLITAVALFGPLLAGARKFVIPMVVGEIIAGAIIGDSGLRIINPLDPALAFCSTVGFAMLLMIVGQKIPLRDPSFKKALGQGLSATALAYVVAIPAGFLIAHLVHIHLPWMFVLLCACSSSSIVLRMLDERPQLGNAPKVTMLRTWIPVADMSTLVILPLAMSIGSPWKVLLGAGAVALMGFAAFYALSKFQSSKTGTYYRQLSKERGWALDLRLHLGVLFGLCWLSLYFGSSVIVAGFVTGAVVNLVGVPKRFHKQLLGQAEGFWVPAFFVVLGAKIDIRGFFSSIANIELALAIAVGTLIVHLIVARLIKLPMSFGLMATASSGLPAAIVSVGLTDKLLTPGQSAAVIVSSLITIAFSGIGLSRLISRVGAEKPPDISGRSQVDSKDTNIERQDQNSDDDKADDE